LKNLEIKEGLGAGGNKVNIKVGSINTISIGGVKAENSKIGIMKNLPRCVGQGVIGYEFLKQFILIIDYKKNNITLTTPDEKLFDFNDSKWIELKLARHDKPIILTDVNINRTKTYKFILDTGASQTIVSPILAEQMGIDKIQGDMIAGAGGTVSSLLSILKSVQIGDTLLENVNVIVSDVFDPFNKILENIIDGILGYNILSNFIINIDYPGKKIQLVKN
jgi:predicted aspartyl protease